MLLSTLCSLLSPAALCTACALVLFVHMRMQLALLVIQLRQHSHPTFDPMLLPMLLEHGQPHQHDKVGRMAGGGEDSLAQRSLVHGAFIDVGRAPWSGILHRLEG